VLKEPYFLGVLDNLNMKTTMPGYKSINFINAKCVFQHPLNTEEKLSKKVTISQLTGS